MRCGLDIDERPVGPVRSGFVVIFCPSLRSRELREFGVLKWA